MTKLILTAIVTIGGFAFWLWRRYLSKDAEIARTKKRLLVIERSQQDALEIGDTMLFDSLDRERVRLCQEIGNLR